MSDGTGDGIDQVRPVCTSMPPCVDLAELLDLQMIVGFPAQLPEVQCPIHAGWGKPLQAAYRYQYRGMDSH